MSKKKTRPEPLGPPQGDTWRAYDIALEEENARVEIAFPGGGGVTVYGNGHVDRWS